MVHVIFAEKKKNFAANEQTEKKKEWRKYLYLEEPNTFFHSNGFQGKMVVCLFAEGTRSHLSDDHIFLASLLSK